MRKDANLTIKARWQGWLNLSNPSKTLDEAIADLQKQAIKDTGKKVVILEKDYVNKRIKILDKEE